MEDLIKRLESLLTIMGDSFLEYAEMTGGNSQRGCVRLRISHNELVAIIDALKSAHKRG